MNQSAWTYSVLVLFGKEIARSVASSKNFSDLSETVAELLMTTGCRVKARGTIDTAKGKNIAPRRGFWSPPLREKFVESLGRGSFLGIELFDSRWVGTRWPDAFGAIHKYWYYGPDGDSERSKIGAENHVTIALREDRVDGAFERLKSASHELLEKIDGFYGAIESDVPWDQPVDGMFEVFEDMIDLRWHNRGDNDYRNGEYQMEKMVARLARGNIFCRTQFTDYDLEGLRSLRGVTTVEKWQRGLTYLELDKQPKYGSRPPTRFADFIRFVPEESDD